MTVRGSSFSVPGGTNLVGALDASRLLLKTGEELAVFDLGKEAITRRRRIPGLTYASVHGAWILAHDAGGASVLRGDLEGDPVPCPEPKTLFFAGAVGSIGVVANHAERIRFDLARGAVLERSVNDATSWYGSHAGAGLLLGVRERTREIVALRVIDGSIAWEAKPFGTKVDAIGHPCGRGDEVHVRADALDKALVARLDVRDGSVRAVRSAPVELDSWLPDLGEDVDRGVTRFERRRSTFAVSDGIVVSQDDQAIVVRAAGIARVATPYLSDRTEIGGSIAGIVADRTRISLVVFPLPASGEHELELVPKGEEPTAADVVPAVVTFAGSSAPIVIVQHPQYGRVNLTRDLANAPPPVGAQVVLDGVEVKPGGVVRVERWWIAGVREPRETMRVALGPPAMAREEAAEASNAASSLAERAADEGITVPDDVLRFVALVDRDPPFRRALASLGFHFDEDELGLDILPELEIEGFVPIWGNGFGDGYGGLTKAGLGYLHVKDDRVPRALPSIVAHVRTEAKDSDQEATSDLVLRVLEREFR